MMKSHFNAWNTCKQLCSDKLNEIYFALKVKNTEMMIDLFNEYKTMIENDQNIINTQASKKYILNEISDDEYIKRNKDYDSFIKQAVNSVEEGKMTYKEFYDLVMGKS